MKIFTILVGFLLFCITIKAQNEFIANYPLLSDGIDITGNNDAMTLINTPFRNGGIYCNGIYASNSSPDFCKASTPDIKNFNFNSFTVSVDFYVNAYKMQPVFVCGNSYRWIGFYLQPDSTVNLYYNNTNFLNSTTHYNLNQWHKAQVSYDGTIAKFYLDYTEANEKDIQLVYTTSENQLGIINYAFGQVFNGYIRNLTVSNKPITNVSTVFEQNCISYPNPVKNTVQIKGISQNSDITVFDSRGNIVIKKFITDNQVDVSNLFDGIYFIRIVDVNGVITTKFVKE